MCTHPGPFVSVVSQYSSFTSLTSLFIHFFKLQVHYKNIFIYVELTLNFNSKVLHLSPFPLLKAGRIFLMNFGKPMDEYGFHYLCIEDKTALLLFYTNCKSQIYNI